MKRLFLSLLVALPAMVIAQPNYQPGYVLKTNGDTLKGLINYREWAYSPLTVEFKLDKNADAAQEFNPASVNGFGIYGAEVYVSFTGLVSMNKNIFPDIPNNLDTTRQPGTIFLKRLKAGPHITLYLNNEVAKNRFFIGEKNQQPIELKYYEYYGTSASDEVFDNLFRGQLLLLVYKFNNADKKLLDKIADVRFDERDLEDIVDEINDAVPGTVMAGDDPVIKKPLIRIFAGAAINSITNDYFISNSSNEFTETSIKPKFDVGIDIFINPDIQQFVFRGEVAYSALGGQYNQVATTNTSAINISYTGHYITLTPQFLYSVYNTEKLKIYLDAGFGFRFTSYSSNGEGDDVPYVSGTPVLYFPFQAGMILNKKFEISLTYIGTTTDASYSSVYVTNKTSESLGVKIFLN
jgi:hypothetical protein